MGNQFLRFRLKENFFAVNIDQVDKVIRTRDIQPIKRGPRYLLGTIKKDNKLIPIINLHKIFGFSNKTDSNLAILASIARKKFALLIDSIDGVFQYTSITDPPKNAKTPKFFIGIATEEENIIQILDISKILAKNQKASITKALKRKK